MKAMILAAGVGNRLRPLTDKTPKALIEVAGRPMLEWVARRLVAAGADSIVLNAFHLAEQVEAWAKRADLGVPVYVSREDVLLDTGGGIQKAAPYLTDGRPFFVHTCDVFSDVDLKALYAYHLEHPALATLAMQKRQASRYFLVDGSGAVVGWENPTDQGVKWTGKPQADALRLGFCGIHVISPEIFNKFTETGVFSITHSYLRLAGTGARIQAFRCDSSYWLDIGSTRKLEEARKTAPRG
jgi:NDP-sugar pyrophosphorylase family protein